MANNHITGSGAVSAGGLLATGAVGLCGLGPTALLRRVAAHEAGHVVAGRACGLPVDGVTVDPAVAGPGLAGRAWGPNSRDCKLLAEMSDVPLCEQVRPLMPAIGDDKNIAAEVYAATHARTVELLAGVEAERLLFPDQTPSAATYDMQQALAFASLVASTAKSAAAFFDFARCEAAEILAQSGQLPWRRPNVKRWMVSRSTRSSPLR